MNHTYVLMGIETNSCTSTTQEFKVRFKETSDKKAVVYAENLIKKYKRKNKFCTYTIKSLTEFHKVEIKNEKHDKEIKYEDIEDTGENKNFFVIFDPFNSQSSIFKELEEKGSKITTIDYNAFKTLSPTNLEGALLAVIKPQENFYNPSVIRITSTSIFNNNFCDFYSCVIEIIAKAVNEITAVSDGVIYTPKFLCV